MGAMVRDLMAKSPLLALPLLAFVLFLAVFIGIVIHTWRRRDGEIAALANIPLGNHGEEDGRE